MNFDRIEFLTDVENTVKKLMAGMNWDRVKATYWLNTENPNLGGCQPIHLLATGRMAKLHKFIEVCFEENGGYDRALREHKLLVEHENSEVVAKLAADAECGVEGEGDA